MLETEKQVKKMLNLFKVENQNIRPEDSQFIVCSHITVLQKTFEKLFDMSKISIDAAVPLKMNENMVLNNWDWPLIKRAIERGVKIRFIAQKVDGESMSRNMEPLSKDRLFELRYFPENSNPFGMHIFDGLEVTLAMTGKPVPSLRTNNAHVIKLAEVYFESVWNSAQTN